MGSPLHLPLGNMKLGLPFSLGLPHRAVGRRQQVGGGKGSPATLRAPKGDFEQVRDFRVYFKIAKGKKREGERNISLEMCNYACPLARLPVIAHVYLDALALKYLSACRVSKPPTGNRSRLFPILSPEAATTSNAKPPQVLPWVTCRSHFFLPEQVGPWSSAWPTGCICLPFVEGRWLLPPTVGLFCNRQAPFGVILLPHSAFRVLLFPFDSSSPQTPGRL